MKIPVRIFLFLFLPAGTFFTTGATGQDLSLYEKKWMVQGGDTLPYRVLLPPDYNSNRPYPVLFFLHGAGERGSDNEKQLTHGAKLFLRDDLRRDFPAIVIFPQCGNDSYWSNVLRQHDASGKRSFYFLADGEPTRYMRLFQNLVTLVLGSYAVKKDQVYIGGLSMGAMGSFEAVRRMPDVFAAAIAICGGADPATAPSLKTTAWWIFHGLKDDVVPARFSQEMAASLKQTGTKVRLTLYPDANHNSWDPAFAEPLLLTWLFAQKKQAAAPVGKKKKA